MIRRLLVLVVLSSAVICGSTPVMVPSSARQEPCTQEQHVVWVSHALEKMETIKPGMTRADVLKVFTTEGGLSTRLQRTFVSRDCPYFKVDVEFEAVGRPSHDENGRVTQKEDSQDIIVKVSRPYVQAGFTD
jgi:hypothetical protein